MGLGTIKKMYKILRRSYFEDFLLLHVKAGMC